MSSDRWRQTVTTLYNTDTIVNIFKPDTLQWYMTTHSILLNTNNEVGGSCNIINHSMPQLMHDLL